MSQAKHTPGPWQVTIDCGANVIRAAEKEVRDGVIAYMFSDCVASTWGGVNEANARLIAAAPDLLAALIDVVGDDESLQNPWRVAARAAIAKATGETS